MSHRSTAPLSGPPLYRVSARANVHPATVLRVLRGSRATENNRRAIIEALTAEGFAHLIPTTPPPPPAMVQEPAAA